MWPRRVGWWAAHGALLALCVAAAVRSPSVLASARALVAAVLASSPLPPLPAAPPALAEVLARYRHDDVRQAQHAEHLMPPLGHTLTLGVGREPGQGPVGPC